MYKNTLNALRLCKFDAVIGQGKMVLVREKSWKSQGILISLLCGNPVYESFVIINMFRTKRMV
jgi:hypothetical protein